MVKYNKSSAQSTDQVVVGYADFTEQNIYVNPATNNLLIPFSQTYYTANFGRFNYDTDYEVSMNYMNNRKRFVNGSSFLDIDKTYPSGVTNTMYLFAGNYNNSPNWRFIGRVYYLQITDNSSLVRNMIPVRRNSDNVLGMYDLVSRTFFTNSGTGTFVAGPVASYVPQNQ